MGRAARSFEAEIWTNAAVKEVIVKNSAAMGVELAEGEEIPAKDK